MEKFSEKHIACISKTLEQNEQNNEIMKNLIDLADGYFQSLSVIKANNESLKRQISNFEHNINESTLIKKLTNNRKIIDTGANIEKDFEEKYTKEAQKLVKYYEEEISKKKEEINKITNEHKDTMNSIYAQINAAESNTFVKLNEIQSDLYNLTNQRKKQHLDNVNKMNDLRIELRNLKDEFSEYKILANQKVIELQNKLL